MAMLTQANTQANQVVELIEGGLIDSVRTISNKGGPFTFCVFAAVTEWCRLFQQRHHTK